MKKLQAYFENMCEARTAAATLSEAGFGKAHLDLAGALDYEYSQELTSIEQNRLEEGGSDHLWSLMLGLWTRGRKDEQPVARAPGLQYMGRDECEEGSPKVGTRLVLKMPDHASEEASEKAIDIIRQNGGRIFPTTMV